jgi:uncharacterized protein YndB with AHSA1/START domain
MATAVAGAATTLQVYRIQIKATPQAIWDAITRSEWTSRYGYACPVEVDLKPGGSYRALANAAMKQQGAGDVMIVGNVLEAVPGKRLVQTWHPVWDATSTAEPVTQLTWELTAGQGGVTAITLTHDVAGAPSIAKIVSGEMPEMGGGWPFVLSDLKTLLETGRSFAGL